MLAKVMEAAQAKMGNKDILTDENAQPLEGFNAAYGVATRGDNAFQGDKPAEAFKEIEDIKTGRQHLMRRRLHTTIRPWQAI